jgi:hypothetical protein
MTNNNRIKTEVLNEVIEKLKVLKTNKTGLRYERT